MTPFRISKSKRTRISHVSNTTRPYPIPPAAAVDDFDTFLDRLRRTSEADANSLIFHREALDRAEQVYFDTTGVPDDMRLEMHSPFFMVDPEAIFALYADLPTLERGLGLFQQHCSQCHGIYGRGNGAATLQWYAGNLPRNFCYGKFKSRSTEYSTVPTDSDLFRTLTRGLYGSTMPSFRHLSTEDRWALIQFIKSLANFYDDYDEIVANRFDPETGGLISDPLEIGAEPTVTLESVTRRRILFIELLDQSRTLQQSASDSDRRRLDEYFESIRIAERDLAVAQQWLDTPKPTVDADQPTDIPDRTDLIGRTRLMMSMIPLIVQSDSSRVISLVIQDHQVVPQVDGVSVEHHNLSHHGRDEAKIEQLKKIEIELIRCFNGLLGQLKDKREADSRLLDRTTVLFGSNLGNANAHDWHNLPILLAGGGHTHGRYVAHNEDDNTPLCNLFVRCLDIVRAICAAPDASFIARVLRNPKA